MDGISYAVRRLFWAVFVLATFALIPFGRSIFGHDAGSIEIVKTVAECQLELARLRGGERINRRLSDPEFGFLDNDELEGLLPQAAKNEAVRMRIALSYAQMLTSQLGRIGIPISHPDFEDAFQELITKDLPKIVVKFDKAKVRASLQSRSLKENFSSFLSKWTFFAAVNWKESQKAKRRLETSYEDLLPAGGDDSVDPLEVLNELHGADFGYETVQVGWLMEDLQEFLMRMKEDLRHDPIEFWIIKTIVNKSWFEEMSFGDIARFLVANHKALASSLGVAAKSEIPTGKSAVQRRDYLIKMAFRDFLRLKDQAKRTAGKPRANQKAQ